MVAAADVVVGQVALDVQILLLPEPAGHGAIGRHMVGPEPAGHGDGAAEQPGAHHIQPVVVDGAVHQVAHHQVVLHRHQALGVHCQLAVGGEGERGQDPLQIQLAVAGAGAVAVAQEIVEPVAVQLAAHQGGDGAAGMTPMLQQFRHLAGQAGPFGLQPVPQLRMVTDQSAGPAFVPQAEHLLAGVAEGAMADVMQQGGRIEGAALRGQFRSQPHQVVQGEAGDVQHAEAVGEAAGLGPLEGQVGGAQLADAPQPLEGRGVDQVDHQRLGGVVVIEPDRPMQGVVVGAQAHGASPWRIRSTSRSSACVIQGSSVPPGFSGSGPCSGRSGSMPRFWMSRPPGVR